MQRKKKVKLSTNFSPRTAKQVFGFTSPNPTGGFSKTPSKSIDTSSELAFITQTVSRFTTVNPIDYIKSARPGVFLAQLKNEIETEKQNLEKIEHSDESSQYLELMAERTLCYQELYRLEQQNISLQQAAHQLEIKVAAEIADIESPKSLLQLRSATNDQEECENIKSLIKVKEEALFERKKRMLAQQANQSMISLLAIKSDHLKEKIEKLKQKTSLRQTSISSQIYQLTLIKSQLIETLESYFNSNHEDLAVSMNEMLEYVKKEDPIIKYEDFLKQQKAEKEKKERDFLKEISSQK